ncbi:MAG: tRNA (adenosine(37)-N6)-threonylcarbamoyltransferase complex ATPase subunit type 1 TsaE [Pseudomonadota bacterium]
MTTRFSKRFDLVSEEETNQLGADIATGLNPGDTILLSGPIGAGKTHLARAMILSLLEEPEPVPSPTFTLIQSYRSREAEILHADLYRLADISEITELGLEDAFGEAIVIIEWPDRLPPEMVPDDSISIDFEPISSGRIVILSTPRDLKFPVLEAAHRG